MGKHQYTTKDVHVQGILWKEKSYIDHKFLGCKFGRVTFYGCIFEECTFEEVLFLGCTFIECVFIRCKGKNLSLVQCSIDASVLDLKKCKKVSLGGNLLKTKSVINLSGGSLVF